MVSADAESLRAWARGMYALEAGAELLIRATPEPRRIPGVREEGDRVWIDPDAVLDDTAAGSGGEQRIARIAASLLGGEPVDLSSDLAGLDRRHQTLVLAAVAHATGSHEAVEEPSVEWVDGEPVVRRGSGENLGSLYPWPA